MSTTSVIFKSGNWSHCKRVTTFLNVPRPLYTLWHTSGLRLFQNHIWAVIICHPSLIYCLFLPKNSKKRIGESIDEIGGIKIKEEEFKNMNYCNVKRISFTTDDSFYDIEKQSIKRNTVQFLTDSEKTLLNSCKPRLVRIERKGSKEFFDREIRHIGFHPDICNLTIISW